MNESEMNQFVQKRKQLKDFLLKELSQGFDHVENGGQKGREEEYFYAYSDDGSHVFVLLNLQEVETFSNCKDKQNYLNHILWREKKIDYFYASARITKELIKDKSEEFERWLSSEFEREFNRKYIVF